MVSCAVDGEITLLLNFSVIDSYDAVRHFMESIVVGDCDDGLALLLQHWQEFLVESSPEFGVLVSCDFVEDADWTVIEHRDD